MNRTLALSLTIGATLAALGTPVLADPQAATAPIIETSRVEVQPAGKAFTKLQIENPLGNVRIEGHDGKSIMIETVKRAPDDDTLDRLRVSLVPDADGTVRITTAADTSREAKAQPRQSVAIDLVIRAPRDARIDATRWQRQARGRSTWTAAASSTPRRARSRCAISRASSTRTACRAT